MSLVQNSIIKIVIFFTFLALLSALGFFVANAQETDNSTTSDQENSTQSSSAEDLDANIKKSEKLIRELSEKLEGTPDSNPDKAEAKKLFNQAKNTLNEVYPALSGGRQDEASSKAASSVQAVLEGISKLESSEAEQLAAQDENITHQDLGVGDPTILPGNPLYFFKGALRTAQTFTTFNPVKKAELKMRFANEKIIEVNKLAERGASDDRLKSAINSYEKEVGRVKSEIEKLGGKTEKTKLEIIVKDTADQQIKHHKLLGKFMKEHEGIAPEIEIRKSEAMKHFSESMISVVEPEVMKEKFLEAIEEQKGSAFRHFKHVEMLEEVKDFVPEEARGSIQNAIEQSSKFFEEEFANIEKEEQKLFDKYMEKIGGNEVRHLEAFDSINTFADIEKDMFEEIEMAREKTRKRIEHRMETIEDETRRQVFVAHLEDAKMEDARIVKELENNLAPETVTTILDIKHKMDQKMREKFEKAETVGDLDSFFDEIEDAPDVRMMEVMKEMEEIIPEDKKEFWGEMKKKAMTEMQDEINRARESGRMEEQFRQMAGFDPEQMEIINEFEGEFGREFGFFDDIKKEQAIGIRDRFENFNDFMGERPEDTEFFEMGEHFKLRIEEDPSMRSRIEQFAPDINSKFREFEAQKENVKFSSENLDETIKKAEKLIKELSEKVNASSGNPGWTAANKLLAQARNAVNAVHPALASGKKGEAFGKAVSAVQLASNGISKLENSAFKEERNEYFEERDEFRNKFKELPKEERPDPSQFIKFESKVFPEFKPPEYEPMPTPISKPIDDKRGHRIKEEPVMCGMAFTPARHKTTGECITFSNTCIPEGWVKDLTCQDESLFKPIIPKGFEEKFNSGKIMETPTDEIPEEEARSIPQKTHEISPAEKQKAIEQFRVPEEQKTIESVREEKPLNIQPEPQIIIPEPSEIIESMQKEFISDFKD